VGSLVHSSGMRRRRWAVSLLPIGGSVACGSQISPHGSEGVHGVLSPAVTGNLSEWS
jgi:hypothetical protein